MIETERIPHRDDLEPHQWWACDYPERLPKSQATLFRRGCRPCLLAFIAWRRTGNPGNHWRNGKTHAAARVPASEGPALEEYWFQETK